jgi:hypothetical protein
MLNLKYVNPRKSTSICTLFVKGDWNDADYITEDSTWDIEELNENLPYFSIMLDLYNFDYNYRHKTRDYDIDIRDEFHRALNFYLDYNKEFYQELLDLKKDKKVLSERLIILDEDKFEDVHMAVIADIKEYLGERCGWALPSYEGYSIHNVKEIYIDYKGNKYDILPGLTLEALAELMDREYDNFIWVNENE